MDKNFDQVCVLVDPMCARQGHTLGQILPGMNGWQTSIAALLSDMDVELTALEARRDINRALKQGMMQALLTGRIRRV